MRGSEAVLRAVLGSGGAYVVCVGAIGGMSGGHRQWV